MDAELVKILQKHNCRVTTPRKQVFLAVKKSNKPMSITDIISECSGVDKVSIYRTVDLFNKLGIVVAVYNGWKRLYELASPFRPHHHHLVCTQCGSLTEIHSSKLERIISELASDDGFLIKSHHFEVSGLCRSCQ